MIAQDEFNDRMKGMFPAVWHIDYPYEFVPNPMEIVTILEVPIKHMMDPANRFPEVRWINGKLLKSDGYFYGEHCIWGATARMCGQLLQILTELISPVNVSL